MSPIGDGALDLAPPIEAALGEAWHCLAPAVIRVGGESGPVDLLALHPRRGVALLGFLAEGEEGSPEEAVAAFHSALAESGFEKQFPGALPVVALTLPPMRRSLLVGRIQEALAGVPPCTLAEGWTDWVLKHFAAEPPARKVLRLVAPEPPSEPPPAALRLWAAEENPDAAAVEPLILPPEERAGDGVVLAAYRVRVSELMPPLALWLAQLARRMRRP